MSVTEQLKNEHQLILKYISLMEQYANHTDSSLLLDNAKRFIAFIHDFADNFHHAKEEDVLFRYLALPNVLSHCNPIPQMLFEHNKARELVNVMENALAANNPNDLIIAMRQYASLLKEHIFKEDNILYPMAERGLPDSVKTTLLSEYAEIGQNLNSTAIWQQYQTLYAELADGL